MSFWTRTQARATAANHEHSVKAAYDKGRRDERASRKRHPFVLTGLVVLAAIGASMVTMAVVKGSFGEAGEVADRNISVAAESAVPAVQNVVSTAADAARSAGQKVEDKGRALTSGNKS
jgi:hypothetical protein